LNHDTFPSYIRKRDYREDCESLHNNNLVDSG